jgi:hypothetical protein
LSTGPITQDIASKTVGGTLAFLDWMADKGYATPAQTDPWKTAINKVLVTVEGDGYESLDWSMLDLDEEITRFQKLAGSAYKAESIVAYGRRMRNAFEAHAHYLETGRPPASRPAAKRQKAAEKAAGVKAPVVPIGKNQAQVEHQEMVTFPYPLGDGRMISMTLPPRLKADDVNRITTFIRTLQDDSPERKQLPPHTGKDDHEQAA